MMKNFIGPVLILYSVLMSVTGAEKMIYVQVGESVTLTAPGGLEQKYTSWYFVEAANKLQLAWRNPFGGSHITQDKTWKVSLFGNSLTISDIQEEQFGTFICETSSASKTDLEVTTYEVIKLKVTKPDSVFLPGDSLSLDCIVETPKNQPKPDVHWLNPQRVRVNSNKGTLNKNAESQDNGSWTCVVPNESKAQISVTVVDLAPSPERHYTSTDSPLTIPCSIPSYISWDHIKQKGIQEVQWHFSPKLLSSRTSDERLRLLHLSLEGPLTWKRDQDKDLMPASDATKGNLSLSRKRARVEDRGDFTCSMTFKNGVTLKRTVHVQVLQITSFAGTEIISGQSVNLSCGTGEHLTSDMQLKWFPPEQSSALKSDRHGAHLSLKEVGTADSGKWRCELWRRDEQLASAVLELKIEPTLSVWMLVIICSAAVILILLVILTVILCRRSQRKSRNIRHRLCQCRNPKPKGFYRT